MAFIPSYISLYERGEIQKRIGLLMDILKECRLCCKNYDISHEGKGERVPPSDMALAMKRLQEMGCHNINFVTSTHYTPQIIASLPEAIEMGLQLPLVYTSSGYESMEVIQLLDGIVDIYMPDAKNMDQKHARQYS